MTKMQMKSLSRQRGVSKFGLLMLFVLIVAFLTGGLKVVPMYVDHNLVTGICEELIENGEAANMTPAQVRERVAASLRINGINDFDLSNIRLRKEDGQAIINIAYERRVQMWGNLDVVARFDTTLPE